MTAAICLLMLMGAALCGHDGGNAGSLEQSDARQPALPVHVKETYMVSMRDDVSLATDVYLKYAGYPSHGSVLMRTPYNKDAIALFHPRWQVGQNADRGWPTVVQDMRGRYASEGVDRVLWRAHTDGPDTLQWMAEQDWSNGRVATIGRSALGIAQYLMAGAAPPELSCQCIFYATPDLHRDAFFQGGQFRKSLMDGWLGLMGSTHILPAVLQHENYTRAFWGNVSLTGRWGNVSVPAIHLGGWYDVFLQGTIDAFTGYNDRGGDGARGASKLIIGPWVHTRELQTRQGELTYPPNALDTFSLDMFRDMIAQYTGDGPDRFDRWPTVSYYVMGDVDNASAPGNEWRCSPVWPPGAERTSFYLHENGSLLRSRRADAGSISYRYDPTDPVPTVGGQNLALVQDAGPYDQRAVEDRSDVLVFTSPPLAEPLEATGPIEARLHLSSDCVDTDVTVKLTDVYPDGRSMLITDGILRMRNRNSRGRWDLMQPGAVYEVSVDLGSTSYIWNEGHRIRLAVSSSNYPRFLANPNVAAGVRQNTSFRVANNTLYLGPVRSSRLILPVVGQKLLQRPRQGYLYLAGREVAPIPSELPVVMGKMVVAANPEVEYAVERMEFYVDDELQAADDEAPYQWVWDEPAWGRHEVTVVAHDVLGKTRCGTRAIWIANL